jgi:hypothetical protein
MIALVDKFDHLMKSMNFQTKRTSDDDSITLTIFGGSGSAEVDFNKDSEICAVVDMEEICHFWYIYPNDNDMKASARKIRDLIEKA